MIKLPCYVLALFHRKTWEALSCLLTNPAVYMSVHERTYTGGIAKGVGPGPTLAWPGWKQPDIPVEVDTGRLETDVGRQEF
jgi:hypothetical protein